MKKILGIILKTLLGILIAIVLGAAFLIGRWLLSREDPAAFLPDSYTAYLQVPSIRGIYDKWLNLEAVDVILARPDLAPYRRVVTDIRGLALTSSPILGSLLDVHADIVLLKDGKLLAVLDLGWRGIFTPMARLVAPLLRIKGFSFLNDSGIPMYRYTSGSTTVHATLFNDVAVVSLDADVVKEALDRRVSDTGLAARATRELLKRIRLRSNTAVRLMVDTPSIAKDLVSGSDFGMRVLGAVEMPGQGMLDVELTADRLKMGADIPMSVTMPRLSQVLGPRPAPIGVLRYVPSTAYLLSVSNVSPLAALYRLAAEFQGKDVEDIYAKADAGAKAMVGVGIDVLLFSWIGAEMGAFMLQGSGAPVFFARISDQHAYENALGALTGSAIAGKDSSLVLDGARIDRISIPWYMELILQTIGLDIPQPFFISRGDYFFLSLDAGSLAAVVKASDTGDNFAHGSQFGSLSEGIPADATLMIWYDIERTVPFFLRGAGLESDILRLYGRGIAAMRATPQRIQITLSALRVERPSATLLPGFPVTPTGSLSGNVLALRFADYAAPMLAWVKDRSTLVLADAGGIQTAEAALEPDSVPVPELNAAGLASALWAASPEGTIWRFGPKLEPAGPFPIATGISGPMPPTIIDGKLALFSKADSTLVLIGSDGSRSRWQRKLDAPLFSPPDFSGNRLAFYPRSFESKVHLSDLAGAEADGWPVDAAGISSCGPLIVHFGDTSLVTFMTQAGSLHAWDLSGRPSTGFPVTLAGVFYATPQPIVADGVPALVTLAQDGALFIVGLDGTVIRETRVPDLDGKNARIMVSAIDKDGVPEILLYGSGAFIVGYDSSLQPIPGFPIKGVSAPQVIDLNRDGSLDIVTSGLDGRIYAYSLGRAGR
jgi:hypothetical protein